MESLRRWREPAVVVVTAVLVVRLLLVGAAALSPEVVGVEAPTDAAYLVSAQLGDASLFVLLAGLVALCHLGPATPHARTLTRVALALGVVALLVVLVLAVLGYASFPSPLRRIELASRLLGLVLPAVAVSALALLAARPRPALRGRAPGGAAALDGGAGDAAAPGATGQDDSTPDAAAPDPQLAPTWAPDEAAGAAWLNAGDAASGRPASGWGRAEDAGWSPDPAARAVETGMTPGAVPSPPPTAPAEGLGEELVHPWSRPQH